jgi:hypothetical protein
MNFIYGMLVGSLLTLIGVYFVVRNNKAKAADVVNKVK